MEAIKEWAQSVIIAALIAAIIGALAPSGSLEKPMKIIIALFMLVAFASPLITIVKAPPGKKAGLERLIESYELENEVKNEVKEKLEEEIRSSVTAYAVSLGVTVKKVNPSVKIDSANNISVKSITVVLSAQPDKTNNSKIIEFAKTNFGVEPTITVAFGDENETEA